MKADPSVENYLKRKGWEYDGRTVGQYIVEVCPYCGNNKKKFYINKTTGQFLCWICDEEGNMFKLKKDLGDIAKISSIQSKKKIKPEQYKKIWMQILGCHAALKTSKSVRVMLHQKWGYTSADIAEFRLGLQKDTYGTQWLVIPYFSDPKTLSNAKFRSLPPADKTFKRIKGMDSTLFNIDKYDPEVTYCYLIEGESDTITAHTKFKLKNAFGVTVGARGFKPEWKDFLDKFEVIYIVYDNDAVGQDGAQKIAKRVGIHKCKNIFLPEDTMADGETPVTDITDYFMNGAKPKDFKNLEKDAELFDIDDVIPMRTVLDQIEAELIFNKTLDDRGFDTPWAGVNRVLGRMVAGDLIIMSGIAKVGKTSLALNILLWHALRGVPVLDFCLEMRPERTVSKMLTYLRLVERKYITRDDVIFVRTMYGKKPFYLGHCYDMDQEKIFETIREAVKRYGIEMLVFDHLHFLVRGHANLSAMVSGAVREFKLLAEELRIPIILIAQPRKLQTVKQRMTINDLRDTSAIGQDGDTIVIVHRDRIPDLDREETTTDSEVKELFLPKAEIIVEATRYNPGGIASLHFEGGLSRYFTDKAEYKRILLGRGGKDGKTVRRAVKKP